MAKVEPAQEAKLVRRFKKMFGCDTARISQPCGRLFLIIGYNRNTKDGAAQWYKDGKPIHFDYVKERVIASGDTVKQLIASARGYKRLQGMTWETYFSQLTQARPHRRDRSDGGAN